MTTIIENIGPVSAENSTPNSKLLSREPAHNELSDCLVVEESLSHSRDENPSDISMVVNTSSSTHTSNSNNLLDVPSPAPKSIGSSESNGDSCPTSIDNQTNPDISHNSSITSSSNNIQDAPKVHNSNSSNRDPRLSKVKNSVNLIDIDEDEDIFTIELPKSIIQSAKRPRMEKNSSYRANVRDSPEMEDIINDFYKN